MNIRCDACGKSGTTWMGLARHVYGVGDREHIELIESLGLSYPEVVGLKCGVLGKGNLKELAEKLEENAHRPRPA